MRRLSIVLVAVVVGFLGNVGIAGESPGIPEDIIQALDGFVGTWQAEGKVGDEEQTGGFTCRWARTEDKKKACLIGRFSYKTGDEVRSEVTLIGWNAAKKGIEDRGFDANGGNATLCWTMKSPTLWRGEVTIVEDGQTVKAEADLVKKGRNEIVYEARLETGEVARVVFRKVKEQPKREAKE